MRVLYITKYTHCKNCLEKLKEEYKQELEICKQKLEIYVQYHKLSDHEKKQYNKDKKIEQLKKVVDTMTSYLFCSINITTILYVLYFLLMQEFDMLLKVLFICFIGGWIVPFLLFQIIIPRIKSYSLLYLVYFLVRIFAFWPLGRFSVALLENYSTRTILIYGVHFYTDADSWLFGFPPTFIGTVCYELYQLSKGQIDFSPRLPIEPIEPPKYEE